MSSTYVELEIQNLLNQSENLDEVAKQLISGLEKSNEHFSADNISCLANFLLRAGLYPSLIQFVLRHLDNENFKIPWPYFLEALALSEKDLDKKIIHTLLDGIEDCHAEDEASKTLALDSYDSRLRQWRQDRRYRIHKAYTGNKKNLLEQLTTLRTQQLYEKEKALLIRLQKLYPGDGDIRKEVQEHKQRYALEVLARRSPSSRKSPQRESPPAEPELAESLAEIEKSLFAAACENPEMIADLAIAAIMIDSYETALQILNLENGNPDIDWLKIEALLLCRRFVEVLNETSKLEVMLAHEPETFFATAYLRAQALWGLGQKHTAIEVMESLLSSRPNYRSGSSLLAVWRGQ